ncbi:hypothetical protein [Heliorestis convoluta]|uniref:Flagellar protein FliT n=1 Tax=Heliorestis convoluta TaxID=356322 RepID=A0A5Q2MXM1_9FIRM|nr:hypothetical protein [Heliorestis convoluta]QGG47504.1 hypothetical protein FTV88_1357 [Heliorestis convoluta]
MNKALYDSEGYPLRSEKELWHDYLFLTKEIHKSLDGQEGEMLLELLNQREELQKRIEAEQEKIVQQDPATPFFLKTEEGKKFFYDIKALNDQITIKLRQQSNKLQQHNEVSRAYEGANVSMAGMHMDRQR